jgi:hypothetical protein
MSKKASKPDASPVTSTNGSARTSAASSTLGRLASMASPTAPKSVSTKGPKWELPLTNDAEQLAQRWASGKVILDPLTKRVERDRNDFNAYALSVVLKKMWDTKDRPSNPIVRVHKADGDVDHEFQWLFTDSFGLEFPKLNPDDDARQKFIDTIVDLGLPETDAAKLVDNEFDFNPVVGFRSLTELLHGSYGEGREFIEASADQKAAGEKLSALVAWDGKGKAPPALTEAERRLVLEHSPNAKLRAGFLSRVCNYCHSLEQLQALFTVIKPKVYPAHLNYAIADNGVEQARRKIEAATEVVGSLPTRD